MKCWLLRRQMTRLQRRPYGVRSVRRSQSNHQGEDDIKTWPLAWTLHEWLDGWWLAGWLASSVRTWCWPFKHPVSMHVETTLQSHQMHALLQCPRWRARSDRRESESQWIQALHSEFRYTRKRHPKRDETLRVFTKAAWATWPLEQRVPNSATEQCYKSPKAEVQWLSRIIALGSIGRAPRRNNSGRVCLMDNNHSPSWQQQQANMHSRSAESSHFYLLAWVNRFDECHAALAIAVRHRGQSLVSVRDVQCSKG